MINRNLITIFLCLMAIYMPLSAQSANDDQTDNLNPFLGRWALFLPGGAGWLDVRLEGNYLDGDILWYGGSVTPVSSIVINNDTLLITRNRDIIRKKDSDNNPVRTHIMTSWIECVQINGELVGKAIIPDREGKKLDVTKFTGKKIPALPPAPDLSQIKYGESVTLFSGKNLDGWTLVDSKSQNGFKVENGHLVNNPIQEEGKPHIWYGNLKTSAEFEDFNLKIEVNIPKGNNSGIYLRGIYEVQIFDSYQESLDSHNMGAIYSRIIPSIAAEKPPGEWQSFDITLCDRHVTVILNDQLIINNQPLLGVTGSALTADEFSPGPIYLQGDHGKVSFRNIVLKPILNNK
jgi:hypothetical protein